MFKKFMNRITGGEWVNKTYRRAFFVGFLGVFLLFWVNGAVGIIGSEDNPANLLYGGVVLTGFVGIINIL